MKQTTRITTISAFMILLATIVSGCAQAEFVLISTPAVTPARSEVPPTAIPTPTLTPEPNCQAGAPSTFAEYPTWIKVNPKPILGHETSVNIYVNNLAQEIYQSGSGAKFPVCAAIVKTHLQSSESETITGTTVMVKMPAGYDPEHNDWWWGMYDKEGKIAQMSGKVQVCIDCHEPAASADYVFSKIVLAKSQK